MAKHIVIIGSGNLSRALIAGWRNTPDVSLAVLARSDRFLSRGWEAADRQLVTYDRTVLRTADVAVLATKPKDAEETVKSLAQWLPPSLVFVSAVAGVQLAQLRALLPDHSLVRTMPNICAAVAASVTGLTFDRVSEADRLWITSLMERLGTVAEVSESLLNPMTALWGSGPAYVYVFLNAIVETARELGLAPGQAREMAALMMEGAARLARAKSDQPLTALIDEVVSPGGTTEAMLKVLDQSEWQATLAAALLAAGRRAAELGQTSDVR